MPEQVNKENELIFFHSLLNLLPIERVCDQMKRKLQKIRLIPKNCDELKSAFQ